MNWLKNIFKTRRKKSRSDLESELSEANSQKELWRERYQNIIELSPQTIWTADAQGRVTDSNSPFLEYTGLTYDEVLGEGWLKVVYPDDQERVLKIWAESIAQQREHVVEMRFWREDIKDYRWHRVKARPLKNSHGNLEQWIGVAVDIHEEKIARLDSELKTDSLENSLNGFDIVDENGRFIYANKSYLRMWGYDSFDEINGQPASEHCADPNTPFKIIRDLREKGESTIEFLAKRKDGSTFEVMMWARLAYDSDGREIYPTTSIDISDIRRIKRELSETEARYESTFVNSPHPLWIFDVETYKFLDANQAAIEKYGYSKDELLTMDVLAIRPPEEIERMKLYAKTLKGRVERIPESFTHIKKDGTQFQVEIATSIITYEGRTARLVLANDVTERIRAEKEKEKLLTELSEARESAEKANEAKSLFLANMSHEIRTPMNAILGFSDVLSEDGLTDVEKKEFSQKIQINGDHLLHLIDDILDLSKVEAGKLLIENLSFSMTEFLQDIQDSFNFLNEKPEVSLSIEFESAMPEKINSDPTRMRQILLNLLSNALKFTEKGTIKLKIHSDEPMSSVAHFEVEDTGIGIAPQVKNFLFKPFSQGDSSITRRHGGTGLGLVLSRKIAHAMGGELDLVYSEVNKGSIFRLSLPLRHPDSVSYVSNMDKKPADDTQAVTDYSGTSARILLAEDSPDNEALVRAYLKKTSYEVETAKDGLEVLSMTDQNTYDLILMDVQMPNMDGLEATRQLRSNGFASPIIALTAHALPEEVERSFSAGCNAHLTKPINKQKLIDSIQEFLN